ncbi:hypothetical protein [Ottowia sp.]|uniref:hypothetical protein n=1 Tax=Ottowia sp. TaxID=1898956 RepID=UPI0025F864BC|nr:hypothetical protein [Ottowia sp.]
MKHLHASFFRAAALAGLLLAATPGHAQPTPAKRPPMVIAPNLEGMYLCDEAVADPGVKDIDAAYAYCRQRKLTGAAAVTRLVDTLEPGGPKGDVQVGYLATLQLLALYRHTPKGWVIDTARADDFLKVISQVRRPVVVYFAADHFDSINPLATELRKDPRNLMQLRDGKPLELGYFGYPIIPYTLSTDPAIPVNKYRFQALDYMAKRMKALPKAVQGRIVAYTLAGELHQLFPDFENGTGAYQHIQVTDYSPVRWPGFASGCRASTTPSSSSMHATALPIPRSTRCPRRPRTSARKSSPRTVNTTTPSPTARCRSQAGCGTPAHHHPTGFVYRRQADRPRSPGIEPARRVPRRGVHQHAQHRLSLRLRLQRPPPGQHVAQVVAESGGARHKLGEVEFVVVPRDQSRVKAPRPAVLTRLKDAKQLPGARYWLDMPRPSQDVYYNPLARDWNLYRESQVYDFLKAFHARALKAGLPADKLYSHQIVPTANSSWNPQLFAAGTTLEGSAPLEARFEHVWRHHGQRMDARFPASHKISDYGVPGVQPQQWKRDGAHLAAMQSHYEGGARFISPFSFP